MFCLLSIPIFMTDFHDGSVFPTNQFAISRPRGLPHLRNAGLSGAARFSGLRIAHFTGLLPQISRPESDHCNYFLDPFNRCLGNHISARISSHISCPACGEGSLQREYAEEPQIAKLLCDPGLWKGLKEAVETDGFHIRRWRLG